MVATNLQVARMKRTRPTRLHKGVVRRKPRRRKAIVGKRVITRQNPYRQGYELGYREGVQIGSHQYPYLFEGTSIVIPTYNQLDVLKQCIDSIVKYTELPHEIIIVDNASTDGTENYLQGLGGVVRYRVLESNRGFAGAINVGMMMSKGKTIVLLNNDTLVTDKWLNNLLTCLHSDDHIGMVGPVTNYISGEQQIEVPYQDLADMPKFAREYNQSAPERWRRIERLTGFCLLFRRELFDGIGYFDEGFEIGNFEDDDYNIRVKLLGKSLVMAEDTFIHHFGSVSMKALGERFQEVNDRNQSYYSNKWHNPHEWIDMMRRHPDLQQSSLPHAAYFYPEQIVVQAIGPNCYWIEQGVRRLIEGTITIPAVKLSQIDLRRWPLGESISSSEVERRWHGDGEETGITEMPDGKVYYIEGGKVRLVIGSNAKQAWNLHLKTVKEYSSEMLNEKIQGYPIISPPVLRHVL